MPFRWFSIFWFLCLSIFVGFLSMLCVRSLFVHIRIALAQSNAVNRKFHARQPQYFVHISDVSLCFISWLSVVIFFYSRPLHIYKLSIDFPLQSNNKYCGTKSQTAQAAIAHNLTEFNGKQQIEIGILMCTRIKYHRLMPSDRLPMPTKILNVK